jgi:hypothetical protein
MRKLTFRPVVPGFVAVLVVGACWGCGPGAGSLPSLVQVKGKVTYKGQPVTQGTVTFEPEGYGRPARGKLQSDGTYSLTTLKDGDGVVLGAHRVAVEISDKTLSKVRGIKKYASPNTSKLTAEVSQEKTEFNYELE